MKQVSVYTDGACSGNPGPGGWGAILIYGGKEKEISGFEADVTNNRMELTAVIEALGSLKEPCRVMLYSDSSYVVNAFNEGWLESWKALGWRRGKKNEVKNIDLWEKLDRAAKRHQITWTLVKGHSDNAFNNRCDKLATDRIKKAGGAFDEDL
jgi:ribonuclease HI